MTTGRKPGGRIDKRRGVNLLLSCLDKIFEGREEVGKRIDLTSPPPVLILELIHGMGQEEEKEAGMVLSFPYLGSTRRRNALR